MSLILKNKRMFIRMPKVIVFTCLVYLLFFIPAQAAEKKWSVHGFVAQGLAQASKTNYINDDGDVSSKLTDIGLNGSYTLNDTMRLSGQVVYIDGGNRYDDGLRVDYALLDWSLYSTMNWQVNAYLGRFKNYHWLYSSTRDVPMTRPSIILPQSVYFDGTRDMSVGGDGINLAFKYNDDVVGSFEFNVSTGPSPISDEQTKIIMGKSADGDLDHEDDFQGSLYWQPNLSNWRFGAAITLAKFDYDQGKKDTYLFDGSLDLKRLYANANYQAENWTFSVELLQERMKINNIYYPGFYDSQTGQGGYAQLQYELTDNLQLMTRYEHFYRNKDDKNGHELEEKTGVPHYFGYQNDGVLGLTYHISSNIEIQAEHHWIKGTARLTPMIIPETTINDSEYWQLWAVQLMYWF